MPTALIIGAHNFGFAIVHRLLADARSVTGAARSADTLEKLRAAGAHALEVDATDQASVLQALSAVSDRYVGVDLVVNAASPNGGSRSGVSGDGEPATAGPGAFEDWAALR